MSAAEERQALLDALDIAHAVVLDWPIAPATRTALHGQIERLHRIVSQSELEAPC